MWHEIRKQERKIRCMIVDYKRRAERRRDYYEKIKADPTQFLQIHGRSCKIHLDPQVAAAGDSPAVMMGWQGSQDVIIDRFDVRAHLDHIQEYKGTSDESLSYDERLINYERYRILVQNDFLGVSEEKFLHQIYLEEQFGAVKTDGTGGPTGPQPLEGKKKVPGAAIGYNYDDPAASAVELPPPLAPQSLASAAEDEAVLDEEEEDDSDIDFDMCVDVNKVSTPQAHELNSCGHGYGMDGNDFFSFLTKDKEEADNLRIAKELEEEKAMYSGRKSRRERRAYRDKKLAGRKISPPSYASRKSPTYRDYCELSRSRSKSTSPLNSGKITYITSFSGEEGGGGLPPPPAPAAPAPPPPSLLAPAPTRSSNEDIRTVSYKSRTPDSRRGYSSRYRSRSRSRSSSRSSRSSSGRDGGGGKSRTAERRSSRSSSSSARSSCSSRRRRRSSARRRRSRSSDSSSSGGAGGGGLRRRRRSAARRNSREEEVRRSSSGYRRRSSRSSRSRSRSRSWARHRSPYRPAKSATYHRDQDKSKSKSPIRTVRNESKPVFNPAAPVKQPPPPIISRYYGRRGQSSSSELSLSEDEEKKVATTSKHSYRSSHKKPWSDIGNSSGRNKAGPSTSSTQPKITPQERLKRKMQALLNKQYKADKKAEREKREKEEQERLDREDEMRELSIKLRKRERRRRHEHMSERRRSGSSVSGSSRSRSRSRSASWSPSHRHRRRNRSSSRSRSRSWSSSSSRDRVHQGPRPLVDY